MVYRMEKIEESPNLESLENLELLSPAKDIPAWALRDTQPQPQPSIHEHECVADSNLESSSTIAECPVSEPSTLSWKICDFCTTVLHYSITETLCNTALVLR